MSSIHDLAAAAVAGSTSSSQTGEDGTRAAKKRGAFIVLEGLDRSGKTTQVKLLEQRFVEEGRPAKVMRFPDRTTAIGQMIDGYLKSNVELDDHAIHLLFSANRWEAANQIRAYLAAGITVVSDRFYHSGIVYSAAKKNPHLPLAWARSPDVGLPRPDLVLFLDLDEETARSRGGWGSEKYEKEEMQRTVRELFWALSMGGKDIKGQDLLQQLGGIEGPSWRQDEEDLVVVDASRPVEDVAEAIWRKVKGRVDRVDMGEMGKVVRTAL
ncbi:thymidylate kinase [Trichoderma asperellum]|uniref:Thymidylate kinase n=1 Tax=Trichoderma asperellum TaxID=101201 RepID=A0A6V8QT35_TRIAP|nr:thymidylate kinase-domain-containing protein [Trichoderma asperelloides]GFP55747.1 thymidylate kinase [Trichoderma asperellum]